MDRAALHAELRNALSLSDELTRHEHARGDEDLAAHLGALRTLLAELERDVGRDHDAAIVAEVHPATRLDTLGRLLAARGARVPRALGRRVRALVASLDRIRRGLVDPRGRVPSKPVLGLPLARLVPQDAHALVDVLAVAAHLASARVARTSAARSVGLLLGTSVLAATLVTDERVAPARLLPIEVHVLFDHAAGLAALLAPFALGYARRDPVAARVQIAAGLGTLAVSLLTDYRASAGVTRPIRSRGGPRAGEVDAAAAPPPARVRVPEVQRPLEGLSSAHSDWRPDAQDAHEEPAERDEYAVESER